MDFSDGYKMSPEWWMGNKKSYMLGGTRFVLAFHRQPSREQMTVLLRALEHIAANHKYEDADLAFAVPDIIDMGARSGNEEVGVSVWLLPTCRATTEDRYWHEVSQKDGKIIECEACAC